MRDNVRDVKTDEHWRVVGFPYHDGHLDGVILEDGGATVRLPLRSVSGILHTLRLRHVARVCVDGLREGNIVLVIRLVPVANIDDVSGLRTVLRERLDVEQPTSGKTVLFLESSFGATVVALFDEIELVSQGLSEG